MYQLGIAVFIFYTNFSTASLLPNLSVGVTREIHTSRRPTPRDSASVPTKLSFEAQGLFGLQLVLW